MKKLWLFSIVFLLLPLVVAQTVVVSPEGQSNQIDVYVFYGNGCPHCSALHSFLETLNYTELNIIYKEVYFDDVNRTLFQQMSEAYNTEIKGVPTVFIGNKVFAGFDNSIGESLETEIIKCINEGCESPTEKLLDGVNDTIVCEGETSPQDDPEKTKITNTITLPAVISAAAVDAINPCAFAVLILLMTTVLGTGSKKRALFAGLAFSGSIYLSYLLMGIGLYSVITLTGFTSVFYAVVAVLAIFVGLFNLKDYLWYGKWFIMEVPLSWRPRMKSLLRGITSVPGAFLIGFAVSLFLLPCTSGPYIVILGWLAKSTTRNYAFLLLLLYNFIFVLPMLIITFAIFFGFTTTEKAEKWRTRKLKVLHLIAGIIILSLGIVMLFALWLGYV